jgi:tRNA 2-selenouridine synthase SelU
MAQTHAQQVEAGDGQVVEQLVMVRHNEIFTELDCERAGLRFKPTHKKVYTLVKGYSSLNGGEFVLRPTGQHLEAL